MLPRHILQGRIYAFIVTVKQDYVTVTDFNLSSHGYMYRVIASPTVTRHEI